MNIIFLVCDALRTLNLGCYGGSRKLSPEIDRVAKKGILFANAFSTINATDPSFTTIFTGKYPASHGVLNHGDRTTKIEKSRTENLIFLPEILREHGFVTIGIDWLGKWHKRGYDFYGSATEHFFENKESTYQHNTELSGFSRRVSRKLLSKYLSFLVRNNRYYSLPSFVRKYICNSLQFYNQRCENKLTCLNESPILSDSTALSNTAIRYIEKFAKKKNFFLFVHYWDNHIPYAAPRSIVKRLLREYDYLDKKVSQVLRNLSGTKAKELISIAAGGKIPKTIGEIIACYDASVKYVDSNVGRLYNCLEDNALLDDSLIIITSDHGESLGEHDIFFDHHGLYDPQIKVPLILSNPGLSPGSVYDEFVQHFDIMPTVLDFLGIRNQFIKFDGESMLGLIERQEWNRNCVFAEENHAQKKRMIRDKNYKYIKSLDKKECSYCQRKHSDGDEFYNLQTDPEEYDNIVCDIKHRKYKNELEKFINRLDETPEGKKNSFEDEKEVNKRLKDLGYL